MGFLHELHRFSHHFWRIKKVAYQFKIVHWIEWFHLNSPHFIASTLSHAAFPHKHTFILMNNVIFYMFTHLDQQNSLSKPNHTIILFYYSFYTQKAFYNNAIFKFHVIILKQAVFDFPPMSFYLLLFMLICLPCDTTVIKKYNLYACMCWLDQAGLLFSFLAFPSSIYLKLKCNLIKAFSSYSSYWERFGFDLLLEKQFLQNTKTKLNVKKKWNTKHTNIQFEFGT